VETPCFTRIRNSWPVESGTALLQLPDWNGELSTLTVVVGSEETATFSGEPLQRTT